MDKRYDGMSSREWSVIRVQLDTLEARSQRLVLVAEQLGDIGAELRLETFAQIHDPLVAVALATWSDRITDLAVFAHCGAGKPR